MRTTNLVWRAVVVLVVSTILLTACGPSSTEASSDMNHGVLLFSDEFDGPVPDPSRWTVESRDRTYLEARSADNPAMVSMADGLLRLSVQSLPHLSQPYSGAILGTRDKFHMLYGYAEACLRMPGGSGLYGAFWLYPVSNQWPPEIDIVEVLGRWPTTAWMTVHWFDPTWPNNDAHPSGTYTGPDFTHGMHRFGMEWMPDRLVWYIDGVERYRTTEHVPHEPMVLVLNVELATYAGAIDATTILPASMLVDYVRVYRLPETPQIPQGLEVTSHGVQP